MTRWYKEDYSFEITVVTVGLNGKAENCRNNHEVGNRYTYEYGCPDGFCSKSMAKQNPFVSRVICQIYRQERQNTMANLCTLTEWLHSA